MDEHRDDDRPISEQRRQILAHFVDEAIPFNRVLGIELGEARRGRVELHLPFREELIGDPMKRILHGGVISAFLDVAGGAVAFTVMDLERERALNTVDLRVDFVRPGRGSAFVATGRVLRKGNRLCVTRMEIHNDQGELIAHGTGVYSVLVAQGSPDERGPKEPTPAV